MDKKKVKVYTYTLSLIHIYVANKYVGGRVMKQSLDTRTKLLTQRPSANLHTVCGDVLCRPGYAGSVLYVPDRFSGCYSCGGGDPSD